MDLLVLEPVSQIISYQVTVEEGSDSYGGVYVESHTNPLVVVDPVIESTQNARIELYDADKNLFQISYDNRNMRGEFSYVNKSGSTSKLYILDKGHVSLGGTDSKAQLSLQGDAGGQTYTQLNLAGSRGKGANLEGKKLWIQGYTHRWSGQPNYPIFIQDRPKPDFFLKGSK